MSTRGWVLELELEPSLLPLLSELQVSAGLTEKNGRLEMVKGEGNVSA